MFCYMALQRGPWVNKYNSKHELASEKWVVWVYTYTGDTGVAVTGCRSTSTAVSIGTSVG